MTTSTTFRLRKMRERAGMSLRELARLTGLDQHPQRNRLRTFESGVCAPSFAEAISIAKALGCSLDELAGIEAREERVDGS